MKASMWSSYLYYYKSEPEEAVDIFLEHNFKYSELSDEHGQVLLARGNAEQTGRKLKKYCDDRNFSFPQAHFDLEADIAETNKRKRVEVFDSLKRWCDLFNALDVKAGVLHPCSHKYVPTKDAYMRAAEMLEKLLEYSRGSSFYNMY